MCQLSRAFGSQSHERRQVPVGFLLTSGKKKSLQERSFLQSSPVVYMEIMLTVTVVTFMPAVKLRW
jgi:positive regulator of sigma E activity